MIKKAQSRCCPQNKGADWFQGKFWVASRRQRLFVTLSRELFPLISGSDAGLCRFLMAMHTISSFIKCLMCTRHSAGCCSRCCTTKFQSQMGLQSTEVYSSLFVKVQLACQLYSAKPLKVPSFFVLTALLSPGSFSCPYIIRWLTVA